MAMSALQNELVGAITACQLRFGATSQLTVRGRVRDGEDEGRELALEREADEARDDLLSVCKAHDAHAVSVHPAGAACDEAVQDRDCDDEVREHAGHTPQDDRCCQLWTLMQWQLTHWSWS